ncbi:hypothetical protein F5B20DRAFT_547866 [Whalleya microplaca]|nr:hypothetical protein F5B20DRAFT_547866 [Whalleya microplaca]
MAIRLSRLLPFSPSTTPLHASTYLLGISLFSIAFLVFLNSAVSFVITDLLGVKSGVGDIVGTLGFVDELVALVACPFWGLVSDRLGVRWVAVLGYAVIALALVTFVQARNAYPDLVFLRVLFAVGATAAATMVTAILPVLTDDDGEEGEGDGDVDGEGVRSGSSSSRKSNHNQRDSVTMSLESDATITPERFSRSSSSRDGGSSHGFEANGKGDGKGRKPSALAGYVGLFTGCGALVALVLFLPLPAQFSRKEGVTPAQAITDSFYVVAAVALCVAVFVFFGLRGLRGEEGKGWRMLLGLRKASLPSPSSHDHDSPSSSSAPTLCNPSPTVPIPYHHLLLASIRLGFRDPHIALGYLGGFVARASTVAISLFVPLYVNAFYISQGFCTGSPNDPSPELKKECRAAYVLASILTGVAQLAALLCAPLFGYASARFGNAPVVVSTLLGVVGYAAFPALRSPEFRDVEGRGGGGVVFLVVVLMGVSQIGAIVCSLGSLGRGVLRADAPSGDDEEVAEEGEAGEGGETDALLPNGRQRKGVGAVSRVQLKGSIAGVYSWCGGAAILLLTKLGGYLFDVASTGAPFYMMAAFNAVLLVASLGIDLGRGVALRRSLRR